MKYTLPGQIDLPVINADIEKSEYVRRLAALPLMPTKEQKPCDIGLFSDDAIQIDLIEMLIDPVDDEI